MPFPNRMVIQGDRFYVASRRRRKERFLGMIRQIKLSPGMSIASLMCDHQSPHFDPNLAEERPTKSKKEFRPSIELLVTVVKYRCHKLWLSSNLIPKEIGKSLNFESF